MIEIVRGTEPDELRRIRLAEIERLLPITRRRHPSGDEIGDKYQAVAKALWQAQLGKCCYCEHKIALVYNDVEHRRPKARAIRHPGSTETHGYWWLAFTWTNLLFACPACNRSRKRDLFPLDVGSVALAAGEAPPGRELPLLLDPAEENPVEHIEFVFTVPIGAPGGRKHWRPRARGGSRRGDFTIRVCGLDDHVELYDDHVNRVVREDARDLLRAIENGGDVTAAFYRASRLLHPGMPFVGLSYDALRFLAPDAKLARAKLAWPAPSRVGKQARRRR